MALPLLQPAVQVKQILTAPRMYIPLLKQGFRRIGHLPKAMALLCSLCQKQRTGLQIIFPYIDAGFLKRCPVNHLLMGGLLHWKQGGDF